jgi:Flp pilus assembly protein TadD
MDRGLGSGSFVTSSACVAALLFAFAPQAAASSLSGTYDSPLGKVRLVEKAGVVTGTIAGKNPCGFKTGKKVLEGSRLDDSVTGTVYTCKLGDGCSGEVDGVVMLLVTQQGKLLSGAVHLDAGQCKSPLVGDGIALKRAGTKTPAEIAQQREAKAAKEAAAKQANAKQGNAKQGGKAGAETAGTSKASGEAPKRGRAAAEKLALEGQMLFESGSIEEARARFLEATQVDPSYSQAFVGVGVTYYMRDRYDEALDYYKQALEADPGNRDAYYNIGCVYALKGDQEQALRYLRIAVLNGYVDMGTLDNDPDLKSLHEHPDFQKLRRGEL